MTAHHPSLATLKTKAKRAYQQLLRRLRRLPPHSLHFLGLILLAVTTILAAYMVKYGHFPFIPRALDQLSSLQFDPSTIQASLNSQISARIYLYPNTNPVSGVDLVIDYDPQYLTNPQITPGSSSSFPTVSSNIDTINSLIRLTALTYNDTPGSTVGGSGAVLVATLTFTTAKVTPTGQATPLTLVYTQGATNDSNISVIYQNEVVDALESPQPLLVTITQTNPPPASPTQSTLSPTPTGNPRTINVNYRLQGITRMTANPYCQTTRLEFIPQVGGTSQVFSPLACSNDQGVFSASISTSLIPSGTYDILIKTRSHLQKRFTGTVITLPTNPSTPVTITLTNTELLSGDINNDNVITITDIGQILAHYISFRAPVTAGTPEDINADGYITLSDVALATLNHQDYSVHGDQ